MIAVGVIGEYIGRIYDQTKGRPVFIASEVSDNKVGELAEVGQASWLKR